MTIAQMLVGIITSQVLFLFTKLFFINVLNIESMLIQWGMWLTIAIISIAIVRRMGALNYMEDIFLIIVWLLISLAVDFVITTSFTGREVYKEWYWWITYAVMVLAMFLLHKKSHVEIRKMVVEQAKNK